MIVSTITDAGRGAIAAAVAGEKLTFTRFGIGDGALAETETAAGKEALTSEVLNVDIAEFTDNGDGTVTIGGVFTSADVERAFFYRELGLYATVGDSADPVLIVYGNAGDAAEYITKATAEESGEFAEKGIRLRIEINAANVSATIDPAVLATRKYVNEKTAPLSTIGADVETLKQTVLKTDKITNCFTALPQNEYTLTDGVLTFKAGSKFFKPDGSEITIERDLQQITSTAERPCLCWLRYDDPKNPFLQIYRADSCFAGTTAEREAYAAPSFWYDTMQGKFYYYDDTTAGWVEINMTLPAAIVEVADNTVKFINTFDGMGFFGSLLFATKGIKGFVPFGRNKVDGTAVNYEIELNTLKMFVAAGSLNGTFDFFVNHDGIIGLASLIYDAGENKNFDVNGNLYSVINAGRVTLEAGRIISFNPKAVYLAADDNAVMHKGEVIAEDIVVKTGKQYSSIYISSQNLSVDEAPEKIEEALFGHRDKIGNALGGFYANKGPDGVERVHLFSRNKKVTGIMGIDVYPDGTIKVFAPATAENAAGNEIATADWVNKRRLRFKNLGTVTGTVSLSGYLDQVVGLTTGGNITFALPTVNDGLPHEIKIFMNTGAAAPTIAWGVDAANYYNAARPDITANAKYTVYFDFNPVAGAWICGVMKIGSV